MGCFGCTIWVNWQILWWTYVSKMMPVIWECTMFPFPDKLWENACRWSNDSAYQWTICKGIELISIENKQKFCVIHLTFSTNTQNGKLKWNNSLGDQSLGDLNYEKTFITCSTFINNNLGEKTGSEWNNAIVRYHLTSGDVINHIWFYPYRCSYTNGIQKLLYITMTSS